MVELPLPPPPPQPPYLPPCDHLPVLLATVGGGLSPALSSGSGRPVGDRLLARWPPRVHHHLLIDFLKDLLSHVGVGCIQRMYRVPPPV